MAKDFSSDCEARASQSAEALRLRLEKFKKEAKNREIEEANSKEMEAKKKELAKQKAIEEVRRDKEAQKALKARKAKEEAKKKAKEEAIKAAELAEQRKREEEIARIEEKQKLEYEQKKQQLHERLEKFKAQKNTKEEITACRTKHKKMRRRLSQLQRKDYWSDMDMGMDNIEHDDEPIYPLFSSSVATGTRTGSMIDYDATQSSRSICSDGSSVSEESTSQVPCVSMDMSMRSMTSDCQSTVSTSTTLTARYKNLAENFSVTGFLRSLENSGRNHEKEKKLKRKSRREQKKLMQQAEEIYKAKEKAEKKRNSFSAQVAAKQTSKQKKFAMKSIISKLEAVGRDYELDYLEGEDVL